MFFSRQNSIVNKQKMTKTILGTSWRDPPPPTVVHNMVAYGSSACGSRDLPTNYFSTGSSWPKRSKKSTHPPLQTMIEVQKSSTHNQLLPPLSQPNWPPMSPHRPRRAPEIPRGLRTRYSPKIMPPRMAECTAEMIRWIHLSSWSVFLVVIYL